MQKKEMWLFLLTAMTGFQVLYAGKGKLRIASDPTGAYIYIDGKKKTMTGEGFTSILLEEGEYTIKLVKPIDEKNEYTDSKKIFVGEDTSIKIHFELIQKHTSKIMSELRKRWKRNNEAVIDEKLGLMWEDNYSSKSMKKTWNDAKKYCKKLSSNGFKDWRMPTYTELLSIVDYGNYNPSLIPVFKYVNTANNYWSSSIVKGHNEYVWCIDFEAGNSYHIKKTKYNSVRCVRSIAN